MIIFEIEKPGTWLNQGNDENNWSIRNLLDHLIDSFYEMNLSLNLFNDERVRSTLSRDLERDSWEKDNELRQKIQEEIKSNYINYFEKYDEISFQTEIKFKRKQWSTGKIPSTFSGL